MGRVALALAAGLVLASAAAAGTPAARVVAVPGADLRTLERFEDAGAVGLVVPDAGPRTSQSRALRALEHGEVVNSLRADVQEGRPLIEVTVVDEGALGAGIDARPGLLVVGVPRGGTQRHNRRYPVVLFGPSRGLLTSESTRIPGLVAIADIAHDRLSVERHDDPAASLLALDERIRENGRTRWWATLLTSLATLALALVAPQAALLATATLLVANLALGALAVSDPPVAATALVAAVLAAHPLARLAARSEPRQHDLLVGGALAGSIAVYFVSFLVDPTWVALSPLGATQNARFHGLSNVLETVMLLPALAGAALLARRLGAATLAPLAVLSLVTVAGSRFGADGGGAIVLAAGFAVLAASYSGGGRRALLVGGAVAAAAVAVVALDAVLGPATHVGETVRGGPGELVRDLADRVELSFRRATDTWQIAAFVSASIVALAVVVARGPRRKLPLAVVAAIAVSLVVNDSPKEVAAGGLIAYLTVARLAPPRRRSPSGSRLDSYAEARRRETHEAQVRP